ncbi:DUF4165 domain-containing protein [Pseudomonas veronii]|uniref:DUF4165 domain-containing protein n=1 Tax=Pseudomonas veronii TaxID=76761 RepID=A0A7Y1A7W0_PSEVE|nr:DUF4165 domain-containing protein [Pseudomonas veronii]MCT9824026.1 DUF4165 domain-containing protein [Pseudomonas veronii]NMY10813.1 DUF4165 domain-containing protein [Pseudomonas veronii]
MGTTKTRGPSFLNKVSGALLGAIALAIVPINGAYADLVKYGYTNSAGVQINTEPGTGFINPSTGISFMVSGGIDRKLRIAVTANGAATPVFTKESSKVLGASDVISYNGENYYAEEFVSPKLPDGRYTVKTEILSSAGAVVQTENVPLVIDTAGPVAGTFAPRPYTWGEPVLTGEVWKLGLAAIDALTYSSFVLDGLSDTSGISKVTANVYRESGALYKAHNVLFSEESKTASIQYRTNFFPDSDLDEVFGLEFVVTDKAGNSTATKRQKVMFDNIANAPTEPFGVYDPSVSTTLAPGLKGFVPYVAGSYVKTNPIRLAWKIPKSNWHTYRQGGIRFTNSFGENQIVGEDSAYVYLVGSLPYRAEDNNYIKFSNFGEWGSQGTIRYDLVLHSSAPKTPVISSVEYYFSDKGWLSYSGRVVSPQELPVTVTKVRYTVEARPFDQVATHMGTCTIPAGQTQCEIAVTRPLNKGTSGYLHDQAVLKSADGSLSATGQWANVWWNDLYLPILSYTYDSSSMILTLNVRQPQQGAYQNALSHSASWLENSSGTTLSVTKKLTSSSGEFFEYEFDLKTLPEGSHDLVGVASENLGAITKLPLFKFQSDRTKPVVTVSKGASDSIDTLDKITFTVTDNKDPAPKITSISLTGGPANESIALSFRKLNATTYGLEYPILFPSLTAGESYTLRVNAQDSQQNKGVGSTTFLYSPKMAGIVGHVNGLVNIPAVPKEFNRNDGSVVINSEQLKLADGTPVSGVYDLLATLRSDAATPLKIGGVLVNPGATVTISQLNFTSTGGKISLPVVPVTQGATGSNGVIISTSAPNAPVVYADINTWMPKVTLGINNKNPVQAMTDTTVKLSASASSICPLTTSSAVARSADPIKSPICLLEWTSIPRGLQQVEVSGAPHPVTQLTGRVLDAGQQKVAYSLYVFNKGTEKVLLSSGEEILSVKAATGSTTFIQSLHEKSVTRAIETASVTMTQRSGPTCSITGDDAAAKSAGMSGGALKCLIEFSVIPKDLSIKALDPLELTGVFTRSGQHPIRWTASVYDTTGKKITLEEGQSVIQVIEPPVTTKLTVSVNESSSVDATPIEDFPVAWEKKTYSVLSSPSQGSVVATPTGFTYTPNTGYVGPDEFRYRVQDVSGMKAEATAVVNVAKFNYAPTWTGVTIQAREGQVSDQVDPEVHDINLWDSHTFKILTNPTHGTVRVFYGRMEYTPNPGFYGEDSFTFSATDQEGLSVEGEGKVTVTQFNFAPTGITPSTVKMYAGIGGTADLKVIDPNNWGSHTLQVVKQPAHGHVTVEGMSITYKTDGQAETSVQIRAIDQDGLYVDQDVVLKLSPAWEMFKDREVQPTSVAPSIPAVKHQMTTRLGAYALRIPDQEVIQALGGEIIAIVTPDSKVGVTLEHRELSQGTGMRLVPTKMTADLLEARLGGLDVGVDGQALVYLSRADMTGPVYSVPVTVWAPEGVLTADAWEILQASGRAQISFSPSNGACSILTSEAVAKPKNALQDRACYVTWTKTPDEWRNASTLANLMMDAGGSSLGNQTIEATAYVFDPSGVKHKVASFTRDLKILPVAGQIRFGLKPAPAEAYQKVQQLSLLLRHTDGPVCDATANEGVAKKTAQQWSSRPSCLIRWMQMPEGMAQQRNTVTPLAEGTMTLLGANNISWKASMFTPSGQEIDIGYGEHTVNVIEPPAIEIDMPASNLVKEGLYSVSQLGGYVGSASVTAIAASLDVAINRADAVIERSTIPSYGRAQRFTRYIEGAEAPLWSVTPYSVDVGYTALPEMRSTKTASLLAVPHDKILPVILNDERTVLDTVSLPIRVAIKDTRYMEDAYRLSSMGDWDIRLLSTTAGVNYEPMTNWEPIDENGEVEFEIDLQSLTNKAVRIIAEARVRSPVPEYELTRESGSPMVLSVLNGESLDGSIQALRVIGPAPLRSSFYAVTNDRYQSGDLGDVRWEMSKDGGVTWEDVEANAKLPQRLSMVFQRGTYLLRAELTNRHSGAKSMTPTVEVIAYVVPVARLKGPANVFIGDSGTFTLTDLKGNALDTTGMVVEWSEDRGKTWAAGEGSYRLSRNSADRVYLTARLKYSDSPEDKRVYKTLRAGVAFRPVRPPRVQIIGPRRPEVGKEATWVANLMMPYPKMDMTMDGEFILPDGTVVDSTEVKYTPTREDMEKEESYISVRSWINGYEDRGGLGLTQHRLIFWSYDWPEWKINTKYSAKYAPADLTMTARSLGLFREFEGLTIEWDIPPYAGLEMIKDSSQTSRIVRLTEPGIYTFGAHITDSRGNYSYAETEMEFLEPIPWDVKLSWSGDNDANRAPLGVLIRPSITGGHPKDQILSKTFSLNGETLSSSGDYGRATLEEEGVYTVKLDVASAMGHTATGQVDISVARNKPPVCKLELVVGRTSWLAKAVCTDEDGRMAKNLWFINGEQQALSSNSISVPMWRYPDGEPVITLVGIDNSGAESPPVSNK